MITMIAPKIAVCTILLICLLLSPGIRLAAVF